MMEMPNFMFWKSKPKVKDYLNSKISVCTLVWNGLDFTKNFIQSLNNNKEILYELNIVDNGSTEETSSYLKEQTENYFKFDVNQGFSKGFNKAVVMSSCEYILLTNNDTVWPNENWTKELITEFESLNNCGLLFPCTNNILFEGNKRNAKGNKILKCKRWSMPNCSGVAFFLKRDTFLKIGGFSEEFFLVSGEDLDLQCKIWDAGYDIYVTERVFVEHIGKATCKNIPNRKELWEKNYFQFLRKWKRRLK